MFVSLLSSLVFHHRVSSQGYRVKKKRWKILVLLDTTLNGSKLRRDTSRDAIQKHFEETGEIKNTQHIEMFCHQLNCEYCIMMETYIRIPRDLLTLKIQENKIKRILGEIQFIQPLITLRIRMK